MATQILDLAKKMVIFQSYVSLPEVISIIYSMNSINYEYLANVQTIVSNNVVCFFFYQH